MMQHLPPFEVRQELASFCPRFRRLLTFLHNVNDRYHDAPAANAAPYRGEQVPLQVITNGDQVPGFGFDYKLRGRQVRDDCFDVQMTCLGLFANVRYGRLGPVYCCNPPALSCKINRVSSGTAGQVQSRGMPMWGANSICPKLICPNLHQRSRFRSQVFRPSLACFIPEIPFVNRHVVNRLE